jgi:hypothetical protein
MVETQIDTGYGDGSAGALVQYLDKGHEQGLKNRYGEEMSAEERERFVEKSREHEFRRLITIAPGDGERLSDREMSLRTRRTVNEFFRDRSTAEYCYAVHRDTEHDHAQVALTGKKRDLYMDRDDLDRFRELSREQFPDLDRERELRREHRLEQEHEQQLERVLEHERERALEHEREQQQERELKHERDRGHGLGW